ASREPRFDPQVYKDPSPAPWLIRLLVPLNRHLILPHVLKLREVDLPAADLARLKAAVNPDTAAFLGPNHSEFMTDWMLDKEISSRCSPLMAHWAAHEIVNGSPLAQRFWLANRLIANVAGGGGKEYSIRTALAGDGVLLHPEGTATWQAERVGSLRAGIVEMALATARRAVEAGDRRPVHIVPIVWRMFFLGDVSTGLLHEMAHVERELGLSPRGKRSLQDRFADLLGELLVARAASLDCPSPGFDPAHRSGYFAAQARALAAVRTRLAERHGAIDQDIAIAQHALRRKIRERAAVDPHGARRDRALLLELQRLSRLDPSLYGGPTLSQEEMAEVLKATRSALVTRGWQNALHNTVPMAVGPRIAHIRVSEPIAVHEALRAGTGAEVLLLGLRERLQAAVEALGQECAPSVARFRRPNPLQTA
ncbi:MAG: hypothetical protein ABIU54_07870, partial [Candidatus Eisenbacteria bacterium]